MRKILLLLSPSLDESFLVIFLVIGAGTAFGNIIFFAGDWGIFPLSSLSLSSLSLSSLSLFLVDDSIDTFLVTATKGATFLADSSLSLSSLLSLDDSFEILDAGVEPKVFTLAAVIFLASLSSLLLSSLEDSTFLQ